MARVKGYKEKLHHPFYDAFFVDEKTTFQQAMESRDPRVIRFFVDVQDKTRLETNLQSSGVLPSLNLFEARALRIVTSAADPKAYSKTKAGAAADTSRLLADLIYNSVTSFLVGEKVMIEMPTFWFPAGSGVSPGNGAVANHGEPDPMATFRFAEPVQLARQQNFRVEMLFPQGVPPALAALTGPFRVWCVLDGFLTRDVQ